MIETAAAASGDSVIDDEGLTSARFATGTGLCSQAIRLGWLVVAVVLLGGCSDDSSLSTQPSRPSLSASPLPEPVVVPTAATAAAPEGAAEFARFFYAQVERAYVERDPEVIRTLSGPDCKACARFIDSITRARDGNQRVEGVVYDIVAAVAPAPSAPNTRVSVIYNGPAVVRFAADGTVVNREPAAMNAEEDLLLVRGARGWLVQEVERR